ncbi:MAG: YidC/Oxa1 family membrane protein insertase [Miniphocaeibacter sp.]|uniref:YidC/Oxa1 family membrane protein insertase n=1 Tax=Miniphocaeibacter sp. TaxID=3100973 RepID=UPI00179487DC|nr:YidC/Oxa1 family membrane protein insertase [Gallicola sp.]
MTKFLSSIIGKILEFIYHTVSNIGVEPKSISYFAISLLILTLIYKLAMLPVTLSNAKMTKINAELQPAMKKLEKKYKHDPQLYQQKVMELQKEMGFSPFASCLPMIVQLIIIWALFPVMREPMKYTGLSETIATNFFWIPDLTAADPTIILPLLMAGSQMLYSILLTPSTKKSEDGQQDPMQSMNFMMKYGMPIMFFFFARSYQAGLALYWTAGNVIEIAIRLVLKLVNKEEEVVEEVPKKKKSSSKEKISEGQASKKKANKKKGA